LHEDSGTEKGRRSSAAVSAADSRGGKSGAGEEIVAGNTTGDLALRWEVARDRRLGRQIPINFVESKTRSRERASGFPSGETRMVPGACVPRALAFLHIRSCYPVGLQCHEAQPVKKPSARPTRNRPSARRAVLVRWSEFFHVSSLLLRSDPRLQQARSVASPVTVKEEFSGPQFLLYSYRQNLSTPNSALFPAHFTAAPDNEGSPPEGSLRVALRTPVTRSSHILLRPRLTARANPKGENAHVGDSPRNSACLPETESTKHV
jgi:hypothetical protein